MFTGAGVFLCPYGWFLWQDPDFRRSEWQFLTFRKWGWRRISDYWGKMLVLFSVGAVTAWLAIHAED